MDAVAVECLRCGTTRLARRNVWKRFEAPECPHCGYLGWAPALDLSEGERREIREHPVELRSAVRVVA
ncbi:MAG: hypothetical protein JOZ56_02040 [Actinobacteria bacterium]|nr:hypothetical protein [Actinomycetota bacterium]